MNSFLAVFKRELKSYFTTPLAYVFLVIFLFFSAYLTFKQGFYEARQADMSRFFMILPLLFVFMVPSTAMRLWAEERKVGSIELLFTLPITIKQAVLGKFVAAWVFLTIALALTFPMGAVGSWPAPSWPQAASFQRPAKIRSSVLCCRSWPVPYSYSRACPPP